MASRALPGTLFQIGYVVPNLDAALAHLNGKLGAPRFMVLREIVVENGWFRGSDAPINHSMAFGYVGETQFEIIENVAGKSTYSEFLDRVPEGGVHHLGYAVDDYDAATADLLARGYRLVQRGTFGDTKFGYFETGDDPGTLTEIVYLDANVRGMFANIKAQTF
jgi:catechol 2,3-dioxygenase-like lactoylglutathione lyase family enzyme